MQDDKCLVPRFGTGSMCDILSNDLNTIVLSNIQLSLQASENLLP